MTAPAGAHVTSGPAAPLSEADLRQLAVTRTLRRLAFASLLALPVAAIVIGSVNRLTGGALSAFASGAPWTQTFWSALFYVMMAGVLLAILAVSRRCPRCDNGFFVSKGYVRRTGAGRSSGTVNVFSGRCVNCNLPLRGV